MAEQTHAYPDFCMVASLIAMPDGLGTRTAGKNALAQTLVHPSWFCFAESSLRFGAFPLRQMLFSSTLHKYINSIFEVEHFVSLSTMCERAHEGEWWKWKDGLA